MEKVDLHTHTTASDGLLSPADLVRLAERLGLKGVAITDHDTVDGVEEALHEGRKRGIEVVPGVEISTLWHGKEIHMLGMYVDYRNNNHFLDLLAKQRDVRYQRDLKMIGRLNELGIDITIEEVMAKKGRGSQEKNVGRPHIAEVLIDKEIVNTMNEAFDLYLGKKGKAYVVPDQMSPFDAIEAIHQSGGAVVIAHPGLYEQDDLIPLLGENGLDGIEINHPDHTSSKKRHYQEMTEKMNLLATAGSDFHGERHGSMYHAQLGTCTTDIRILKDLQSFCS
ncbi:PHP domain-containing protein [Thermoactinomyces mirandus]|uniref:PHP domain-containing protein n=1 Tax=Thermoactinomyces mirandus TaxID=2756294 RepID=A0A7W1XUJ4_9BACL|nr:PHP domain-containing protein [Thermoactinomyces mirandus]MBA4603448.1 PHP domain-containing protein [Thermoactinomyces mirandus]